MSRSETNSQSDHLVEINRVWQDAELIASEAVLEPIISAMATRIAEEYADKNPVVLCVMNGGMIFCAKLVLQMQIPMQLDYVQTSRYQNEFVGGELHWLVAPKYELSDRHVLVVDDLLDEGKTLQAIVAACEDRGASSVSSVVLVNKLHERKPSPNYKADYSGLDVKDHYIFGYGMDYKGYLRNAAGIYAVKVT